MAVYRSDGRTVSVNLPHTWNSVDGQDGGNNYWRGSCRYEQELDMPEFQKGEERVYLEFRGSERQCEGYASTIPWCAPMTAAIPFRVDVTKICCRETNRLAVEADNGVNDRVYPQKADFTFYGGIYRDVNLVVVNRRHFALADRGGNRNPYYAAGERTGRICPESDLYRDGCRGNKSDAALPDDDCEIRIVLLDSNGAVAACGTRRTATGHPFRAPMGWT